MKILITGGYGQLGTALQKVMKEEPLLPTDSDTMDITDAAQVAKVFEEFKPDFLVHGAAYTNVDGCEENFELAQNVNGEGTRILAEACKAASIPMVYISTDYVFDGNFTSPIVETETTGPLSEYGKTKLAGEVATRDIADGYVLRTSWVYGEGNNFVRTMLNLSEKMDEIKVVSDQVGRPTYALDLAKAIYDVVKKRPATGIYNVTGDGEVVSWADFARKIFQIAGKDTIVTDITTEEYLSDKQDKKIAPRPKYSVLDLRKSKKAGLSINSWEEALAEYIKG